VRRNAVYPAPSTNANTPVTTSNPMVANIPGLTAKEHNIVSPAWQPFNLIYGSRPDGMPGRGNFDLATILGLKQCEYTLCLVSKSSIYFNYVVELSGSQLTLPLECLMTYLLHVQYRPDTIDFVPRGTSPSKGFQ
jgi:hypothetical protein